MKPNKIKGNPFNYQHITFLQSFLRLNYVNKSILIQVAFFDTSLCLNSLQSETFALLQLSGVVSSYLLLTPSPRGPDELTSEMLRASI